MISIREAVPEDWPRARDLRLRALADAPSAFGSTLARERAYDQAGWTAWISGWEGHEHRLFAAEDGEAWVGMAVGSRPPGDPKAHLYGMWVDPRARRSGLGRRLVEEVVRWASALGAEELELGVTDGNEAGRALYTAAGFVDTGERHPLREGAAVLVVVMRRRLSA